MSDCWASCLTTTDMWIHASRLVAALHPSSSTFSPKPSIGYWSPTEFYAPTILTTRSVLQLDPHRQHSGCLKAVATSLGLTVQESKLDSGSSLEILGILVNVTAGTARITQNRRDDVCERIDTILGRGIVSALEPLSIAGHLVFITRICPSGRAFLRRIYDAAGNLHIPHRRRVPHSASLDLRGWRDA